MRFYFLYIILTISGFHLFGQSALHLKNGVNLNIKESSVLTVYGNLSSTDRGDTSRISNEGILEVKGNWENNGTGKLVDLSTGLVEFNGTSAQEISGNTAFNNLKISNASGVSIISGNTEINNELELNLGNLATNGFLTLNSIASKTARIAPIFTGSISGDVTVEAYVENQLYDYRFLSMPVQNKTIGEWSDDILFTGFAGTLYPAFHFVNLYSYDEIIPGERSIGFLPATNITNTVGMGQGSMIYLGGADVLVDVKGEIYSGTLDLPVTFTDDILQDDEEDGWNLVGNPYPSTIDWESPDWVKTGLNDAIYIYEGSTEGYRAYINGVGTNGGSRYIPSSQAFWVKANASPTLRITETVKTAEEIGFIENVEPQDLLRLRLSDNNTKQDEIVVRYNKYASKAFDREWDALKFTGGRQTLVLTAILDSAEYSILSLNEDSVENEIYLKVDVPVSGHYTIHVDQLPTKANCLFLEDLFTGRVESLRDSASFRFYFNDSTSIARFKLSASKVADISVSPALCYGSSTKVEIKSAGINAINTYWGTVSGGLINADTSIHSKSHVLSDEVYVFRSENASCSAQLDTISITSPDSITVQTTVLPDTGFSSGSAQLFVSGGSGVFDISWIGLPNHRGNTASNLSAGNHEVKITDSNGCEKKITLTVPGITTSIETIHSLSEIKVYPNPTTDKIILSGIEEKIQYYLFDLTGRVLLSGNFTSANKELAVDYLKSGVYFLRLTTPNKESILKIEKINE